jgi:transcriptional regulator with XRE-family HTH domain
VKQKRSKEGQERHHFRGIALPYLKEVRRSKGLRQKELSELASVSTGTIYRVETGQRGAYPGTLRKLATALGVSPEALVHGKRT